MRWVLVLFSSVLMLSSLNLSQAEPSEPAPHLRNAPVELYIRKGDKIEKAPQADLAVARSYPAWKDKGSFVGGNRATIMIAKTSYTVDEEIRVIHVFEITKAGATIYAMGPKKVYDEFVDGKLITEKFVQIGAYDGMTTSSPGVDFNYEITSYRFDHPGVHTIEWNGAGFNEGMKDLKSNTLKIEVKEKK